MDTYTIWVCVDCMLHRANGECGNCYDWSGEDRENGSHDREPWAIEDDQSRVTMGMLSGQHDCIQDHDGSNIECGCEVAAFSMSSCEGCGSNLGGERHAFTVWFED